MKIQPKKYSFKKFVTFQCRCNAMSQNGINKLKQVKLH